MTILLAGIIAAILFTLGMAFKANPQMVMLVQVLWLILILSLLTTVLMWTRSLRAQIRETGKGFSLPVREFACVESELRALFERIKYIELEKWDRAAKQAGDSLVLMFGCTTDVLTGVANRRRLETYLSEAARKAEPMSLIMMDIDHFKQVNDRYGHAVGDEVLKHFAQTVQEAIRPEDFLARYGGEEFTVICNADLDQAVSMAERVRNAIEGAPARTTAGEIPITNWPRKAPGFIHGDISGL